jgi:hypothetical protein
LDPTTTRLRNWAEAWGYDGFYMLNLFAWRDTDPSGMKQAADPVGLENDRYLRMYARMSLKVVACWGNHGNHHQRDQAVLDLLNGIPLWAFKLTGQSQPYHPLYLPGDTEPFLWKG